MLRYKEGTIRRMIERNGIYDKFAEDGKRVMGECLAEKDYINRSGNLAASYGYGVYAFGKLVRSGVSNVTPEKSKKWYGETINGSTEITNFLNTTYSPNVKTIELVIVAAMPYGEPLEFNTGQRRRRKYKVTSMAYDKLRSLQQKYPHTQVGAILRGKQIM